MRPPLAFDVVLYFALAMLVITLLLGAWRDPKWLLLTLAALPAFILRAALAQPEGFRKLVHRVHRALRPAPAGWTCSACGASNPAEVIECVSCRAADPASAWRCQVCATVNPDGVHVCLRCSAPVDDPSGLR